MTDLSVHWKVVPFGSLAAFKNGVNYSKANFGKGIKVINVKDFHDYSLAKFGNLDEINPEGIVREKDLLQERDILFVRSNGNRDLIGRTLYIAELSERITHSAFTIRARLTTEGTLPRFYAYLLRSEAIRQSLSAFGGGTNISNLNQQILDQLSVPFPPIQIQRKIVAILSAYDDLIENNLRRIKILEEMVQNIYREWFVKFHFPGYEKAKMIDSSLGMIPKGWEVVTVEEIVKRLPAGKLYDHNTVFRDGLVPVLDQGKSGIIGYHNDNPSVQANEEDPVIVFANHTCYQRIIQFPFSAIQNVLPFLPNPKCYRDIYWLHWATKDLISLNDYKGHWPEFMSKQLFLPQDELCLLFGQFAKPIVRECYKLDTINANLQQTRDLLLSKLISGEIDISDLDIKIEEIA